LASVHCVTVAALAERAATKGSTRLQNRAVTARLSLISDFRNNIGPQQKYLNTLDITLLGFSGNSGAQLAPASQKNRHGPPDGRFGLIASACATSVDRSFCL
jgi:hypothetical protein